MSETGDEHRKDDGKTLWSLIPADFMKELAELYTMGAVKYGPHQWRTGMDWSRCMSALERHWSAWKLGEEFCPIDRQHHLVSVVWNAIALWWYQKHGVGEDDRVDAREILALAPAACGLGLEEADARRAQEEIWDQSRPPLKKPRFID